MNGECSELANQEWRRYFLDLSRANLEAYLRNYVLTTKELADYSYPMEYEQGKVYVEKYHHPHSKPESATSSDACEISNAEKRRCTRCKKTFAVSIIDGEYLQQEECQHHWGKLFVHGSLWTYSCCQGSRNSRGCTTADAHVWSGLKLGKNGPFYDFVRTKRLEHPPHDGSYGAYALDCEMVFTKHGLELGKVSVVALDGSLVYETLVLPQAPVIDYCTRFSGLRAEDIQLASKSVYDVQRDLLSFINESTILIGHGLGSDLRMLRILHSTIIDTSQVHPHPMGLPFRNSLKGLALRYLGIKIQMKEHDSAEDARAVMDLMFYKLAIDSLAPPSNQYSASVLLLN